MSPVGVRAGLKQKSQARGVAELRSLAEALERAPAQTRPLLVARDGAVDGESGADGEVVDNLTGHEREEIAKDALSEARRAIAEGALDLAAEALLRAEAYDPGNADIAPLRLQVDEARSAGVLSPNASDAEALPSAELRSVDPEA